MNSSTRNTTRTLGLSLCVLWMWGPSGGALAQEHGARDVAAAREHFDVGTTLYRSGRFLEAASEYLQAYDLSGEPDLLYNVALSYRDAGDVPRAAAMLRRYLAEATELEPGVRALLTHRVEAMERAVAAAPEASTPAERDQTVDPEPETALEDAAIAASAAAEAGPASSATATSSEPRWGAIAAFSLAGLGVIGAAVVGPLALTRRDDLTRTCAPLCTLEEADSVRTLGILTDVSLGVAAAGVVAGLVLWLVTQPTGGSSPSDDTVSVTPAVDGQGASVIVARRF